MRNRHILFNVLASMIHLADCSRQHLGSYYHWLPIEGFTSIFKILSLRIKESLYLHALSRSGQVCCWTCTLQPTPMMGDPSWHIVEATTRFILYKILKYFTGDAILGQSCGTNVVFLIEFLGNFVANLYNSPG